MPRQPFLPKYKGKDHTFGDMESSGPQDRLYALVGRCVAEWSRVDQLMSMILAAMLGGSPSAGVALFTTLRNARAQRDAISAVGDISLDESKRELLEAVINVFISVGKLRHDLAHGLIGYSIDVPDILVWADSGKMSDIEARAWLPKDTTYIDKLYELIFFYKEDDLEECLRDIKSVYEDAFHLYCIIRHDMNELDPIWQKLCSSPRIAQELARLRQGTKSSPPKPQLPPS